MDNYGVEMILGMASDLNRQFHRGMKEGIKIGRMEILSEINEKIKELKDKETKRFSE